MKLNSTLIPVLLLVSLPAYPWNPIRDVERTVRKAAIPAVSGLVSRSNSASAAVVTAKLDSVPTAQLTALEREQQAAETAVLEQERQIRIRVEGRAVAELEKQLVDFKTVPYKIDKISYVAISNTLYGRDLELQPMVYENYVFLQVEPKAIATDGDREVQLRLVVYWNRAVDRIEMRYQAIEKRLRSAELHPVADPKLKSIAVKFIADLASALEKKAAP